MSRGHLPAGFRPGLHREPPSHDAGHRLLVRRRAAEPRAADAMRGAFPLLPGLFDLVSQETIACRCEDVTVAEVGAPAALHGPEARDIESCRAGMGPCQGRICGPNLEALADPVRRAGPHTCPVAQVPAKPVQVGTILA
jgi:hypothetical protein